jgi:hypothetical protein
MGSLGAPGSVRRVPAAEVEALVGRAVREHLKDAAHIDDRDLISTYVVRVDVQADRLAVELKAPEHTASVSAQNLIATERQRG